MAHHLTIKNNSYEALSERINRFPQGAPPSELLYEIFKILFSEKEASLVSLLPIKPFNAKKAAGIWKILDDLADRGILIDAENVREKVTCICNCCGCCCEALIAARRFGFLNPVNTSAFIPVIIDDKCTGCGKCINLCPVEAIGLVSANDPVNHLRKKARIEEDICLGCSVCLKGCSKNALYLKPRKERVITPVNSVHRVVLMAIERGKLHNLIFDNQVYFSHRALAAVLGAILRMPPVKQLIASTQFKSRYLEALIKRQSGH